MKKLACAIALAAGLLGVGPANAQNYPARPVTIVVPYAAGGPTDVLARVLAERMRISLGQPVLVENAIGAGGAIGLGRVIRAAPDGYTVSIGNWGTHVGLGAIYRLDFDLLQDFAPVALLPANPMLIVTRKDVPANDLKTLIGWLKANESKVSVGTSGVGGASHVAGVLFQNEIGAHFQFVPYRGAGPAMNDLVAGQIVLMVDFGAELAATRSLRRDQGFRRYRKRSGPVGARYSDRGRGWGAGALRLDLEWSLGSPSDFQGHHIEAQCRGGGRHGRQKRSGSTRPAWL